MYSMLPQCLPSDYTKVNVPQRGSTGSEGNTVVFGRSQVSLPGPSFFGSPGRDKLMFETEIKVQQTAKSES